MSFDRRFGNRRGRAPIRVLGVAMLFVVALVTSTWNVAAQTVATAGGDPAGTGQMPGPGPDGEPDPRGSFATEGHLSAPVAANETVYVADETTLYALDPVSGEARWSEAVPNDFFPRPPAVAGDVVYMTSSDGNGNGALIALVAADGDELWRAEFDGEPTAPVPTAEAIFFGLGAELTARSSADGEVLWTASFPEEIFRVRIAAVAGGVVYAVGSDDAVPSSHYLSAFDAETGDEVWGDLFSDGYPGLAAAGDGLYYCASEGSIEDPPGFLHALDPESGEERWVREYEHATFDRPAVVDGVVYLGTADGLVEAVDAETGDALWSISVIDGEVTTSPSIVDGVLYVGADDSGGEIVALDAATGDEVWRVAVADRPTSVPLVVDGAVYLLAGDTVYAFGGEGEGGRNGDTGKQATESDDR